MGNADKLLALAGKFAGGYTDDQKAVADAHRSTGANFGLRAEIQTCNCGNLGLRFVLKVIKRFCQIGGSFGLRLFVVLDRFKTIQPRGSKEAFKVLWACASSASVSASIVVRKWDLSIMMFPLRF